MKPDEKTRLLLEGYKAHHISTDVSSIYFWVVCVNGYFQADTTITQQAKGKIDELLADIHRVSQEATSNGLLDKEKYVIPPHLHDLQEADLPETQRGLVISEIAQFRERAAKREREKMRDVRDSIPVLSNVPSGPKAREWGKSQGQPGSSPVSSKHPGFGKGAQGYNKPVGFVKSEEDSHAADEAQAAKNKTDEELEAERKEARRMEEELSFRDVSHTQPTPLTIVFKFGNSANVVMSLVSELVSKP